MLIAERIRQLLEALNAELAHESVRACYTAELTAMKAVANRVAPTGQKIYRTLRGRDSL
jgi:hypothetical protein